MLCKELIRLTVTRISQTGLISKQTLKEKDKNKTNCLQHQETEQGRSELISYQCRLTVPEMTKEKFSSGPWGAYFQKASNAGHLIMKLSEKNTTMSGRNLLSLSEKKKEKKNTTVIPFWSQEKFWFKVSCT